MRSSRRVTADARRVPRRARTAHALAEPRRGRRDRTARAGTAQPRGVRGLAHEIALVHSLQFHSLGAGVETAGRVT